MSSIPRLHLISDSTICPIAEFPDVALRAVDGGVDAVHLREMALRSGDLLESALVLRRQLTGKARMFINDRLDVALLSHADGIELGESSLPVDAVRSLVGDRLLIGRSVHDVAGARRAAADGADFVIAGHVYETASKEGQAGRGLKFIESVSTAISIPVIAIGGITPERVRAVLSAGAYGVAVLSGILAASDTTTAARRYREELQHGDKQAEIDGQRQTG